MSIQNTQQRLRIVYIDNVLEPDKPGRSGMSDTIWDMANELSDLGHEPHIVGTYKTTTFPSNKVNIHHFPTPPIGYRNIVGHLWILKRAKGVVDTIKPDIIHVRDYLSSAVFLQLGMKTPIVLTVPGNIFLRIQQGHGYERYYVELLKWAARKSAKRCAYVVATSREMKHWWEWTGSDPKLTPWIPLGVNTDRFQNVADARQRFGIDPKRLHLLFVGRFSKEKGLLDLIDALVSIKQDVAATNPRITLIGKGPEQETIQRRLELEGLSAFVQIVPWAAQDQLSTWYSAADALLLPSWNEPFGKVMIEAMACGTPVVASMTEGPKDHVHEGKNGWLFPPRDTAALASILAMLIRSHPLPSSYREECTAYAKQIVSWPMIMQRVIREVYQPTLQRTGATGVHTLQGTAQSAQ